MIFDITWLVALISITGSYFNIKKMRVCFVLWTICEIFCFCIDMKNGQFGRAFLDIFCLGMDIYGFLKWLKEDKNDNEFKRTSARNT
jgi:nicotinamide riboside transporter PnuC